MNLIDMEYDNGDLNTLMLKMDNISSDSPTFGKIADYISQNYLKIIFMTAGQLADEVNVSQGSVTKFCINMGYRGYSDFLRSLQKFVSQEITAPQRLQYTSQNHDEDISNILSAEHKNLDELAAIIKQEAYYELVDKLAASSHIVLLSARMSATLLPYTYYILNKLRSNVTQIAPGSPLWDTVNLLDPESTLIFTLTFPRYSNTLLNKLQELSQEGFTIAAITDNKLSPVRRLASPCIGIPITVPSIFDIYSTPLLLINILLRDVAKKMPGLDERLDRLEKMERRNNIYYKKGD